MDSAKLLWRDLAITIHTYPFLRTVHFSPEVRDLVSRIGDYRPLVTRNDTKKIVGFGAFHQNII